MGLREILDGLAARMSREHRHAFVTKMAAMDRDHAGLTPASMTLGHA